MKPILYSQKASGNKSGFIRDHKEIGNFFFFNSFLFNSGINLFEDIFFLAPKSFPIFPAKKIFLARKKKFPILDSKSKFTKHKGEKI